MLENRRYVEVQSSGSNSLGSCCHGVWLELHRHLEMRPFWMKRFVADL